VLRAVGRFGMERVAASDALAVRRSDSAQRCAAPSIAARAIHKAQVAAQQCANKNPAAANRRGVCRALPVHPWSRRDG
jgi:hypothetical protein